MCFSVFSLALSLVLLKALHANEEENANGEHDVFLRRPMSLAVIVVTSPLPPQFLCSLDGIEESQTSSV